MVAAVEREPPVYHGEPVHVPPEGAAVPGAEEAAVASGRGHGHLLVAVGDPVVGQPGPGHLGPRVQAVLVAVHRVPALEGARGR